MNKEEIKTPDILLTALRQYQHNDCSGLLAGFEYKETIKIVLSLLAKCKQSQWTYISTNESLTLINLPNHEQEVLFKYGNNIHAGVFMDDLDSTGENGDFGFYDNRDNYYEAENVLCWKQLEKPPQTSDLQD